MFLENSGLYQMHEWHKASFAPLQMLAKMGRELYTNPASPLAYMPGSRHMAAGSELLERVTRKYNKPEFGLTETVIDGKTYKVTEKAVMEKPFCTLLKFQHHHTSHLPKMLVVAPLSGHYATLLRGTVEALIPHFEVYITDWMDAREVPVYEGTFDLDDYIDYVHEFISVLGPEVHVLAVCQPAVPVLAAVSIMNAEENPKAPRSMTLIGGPIDTRINPTEVNRLAYTRSLNWFEQNVVTRVPFNYPGFMRRVYPGFLQLSGFMQLNLERHIGEHIKLFQHLVKGDGESAEAHRKFYNEYLSVLDLPAEFYLQTIKTVFQDHSLPRGKMVSRGRKIQPSAITRTALLTLEGELDDISGVGQTKAAQKLCKNLPEDMKHHHCQPGVGHYGIFNGRKYREHVVPIIVDFCNAHNKAPAVQVSSLRSASL
ncbi:polyhydroxyalkanoate depolymerase [bacterium]|nr:polyhydroxyalkanoate depolymerase [bacterium]